MAHCQLRLVQPTPFCLVIDSLAQHRATRKVVSVLMRSEPASSVTTWIAERDLQDMYLTAISEAELRYGVAVLPSGRKRRTLEVAVTQWLKLAFAERILPFDSSAAKTHSHIAAVRRQSGKPISDADCQIAAISRTHDAILITRNLRDFAETGVENVNPWAIRQ